jgi:hypothetical protein
MLADYTWLGYDVHPAPAAGSWRAPTSLLRQCDGLDARSESLLNRDNGSAARL